MQTIIAATSRTIENNFNFGVEDAKGRQVGAVVRTYQVTYENSATGFSSSPEGTFYMSVIVQLRGNKAFESTRTYNRFDSAAKREENIMDQLESMGFNALNKFAS